MSTCMSTVLLISLFSKRWQLSCAGGRHFYLASSQQSKERPSSSRGRLKLEPCWASSISIQWWSRVWVYSYPWIKVKRDRYTNIQHLDPRGSGLDQTSKWGIQRKHILFLRLIESETFMWTCDNPSYRSIKTLQFSQLLQREKGNIS